MTGIIGFLSRVLLFEETLEAEGVNGYEKVLPAWVVREKKIGNNLNVRHQEDDSMSSDTFILRNSLSQ